MGKFTINKEIFNYYHDLQIGVVVCKNINNTTSKEACNLLESNIKKASKELYELSNLTELSVIKDWRNAYKKFNEKKNRSSIESLLRRIYNNKPVSSINPLVDIYNSISIKYKLPCGGEDINKFSNGNIELTLSKGTENFLPLGSEESESPTVNEVIYKTENTVICRCFNWRESDITKLTPDTRNAFLCIECLNTKDTDALNAAINDLNKYISTFLGGTCSTYILDCKNNTINF